MKIIILFLLLLYGIAFTQTVDILMIPDPQASVGSSHDYKQAMYDSMMVGGGALSPDAYLMLGDYTELAAETVIIDSFQTWEDRSLSTIPKYYAIGNHDIFGPGVAVDYDTLDFYNTVGYWYGLVDDTYMESASNTTQEDTLGYYHTTITANSATIDLIVLNNNHRDTSDVTGWYFIEPTQYTWLSNKLNSLTGSRRLMITGHAPMYQDNNQLAMRTTQSDSLVDLLADWQSENDLSYFLGFFFGHAHTPNDTTIKVKARNYRIYDVDIYTFANAWHAANYTWAYDVDSLGYALVRWDEDADTFGITGYGLTMTYSKTFPSWEEPNLSGYWTLAAADTLPDGTFKDFARGGNHGTATGTTQFAADHNGTANGAFDFDGSSYVRVSDYDEFEGNGGDTITYMFRFKSSGTTQDIFSHYDSGLSPKQMGWRFLMLETSIRIYASTDGTDDANKWLLFTNAADYTNGAWHHIAVVFTGDIDPLWYGDGALLTPTKSTDPTPPLPTIHNSTVDIMMGAIESNGSPGSYFTGQACDFRIYADSLTAEQIEAIYSMPALDDLTQQYYVDNNGVDGNAGTSSDKPWKTIAKVNTNLMLPNDSTLLNKGNTWREQYTQSSSGDGTGNVTLGAYGTGADPIISGANPVVTWTVTSSDTGWLSAWTGDEANEWTIHGERNYRNTLNASTSPYDGDSVRVTVKAADGEGGSVDGFSIGVMTSGDDYDNVPTRITFADSSDTTIAAGDSAVSDPVAFSFDKTVRYGLHVYTTDRDLKRSTGPNQYWDDGSPSGDQTMVQIGIGATGNSEIFGVTKLEVYGEFSVSDVYQSAVTTQPTRVWFNGTLGTLESSIGGCDAAREWYWNGDILYIYSATGSDTTNLEAGARDYCVRIDNKDYITIDGLSLRQSDGQRNLYALAGSYLTVQNVTSIQSDNEGIFLLENPNSIVQDCKTHSNETTGITLKECASSTVQRDTSYSNGAKGIDIEADSGDDNATDNVVQDNICHTNGREGIDTDYADRTVIRRNEVYNNDTDGAGVPGISIGVGSDSNRVSYNLIHNNADHGITLEQGGGNNHCFIDNNVFYANGDDNIYLKADSCYVRNNISMNPTDKHLSLLGGLSLTLVTSDNNLFYPDGSKFVWLGTVTNFAVWQDSSNGDANSPTPTDPLMTDPANADFTLQKLSPCIDAGVDVGLRKDKDGNTVPFGSAPDIGAYELQSSLFSNLLRVKTTLLMLKRLR